MEVTAAVTASKGAPFALRTLQIGEHGPQEVLVEIKASGICHTDLIIRDQWYPVPLPAVLGHEGAGVVQAVGGAVTAVAPGDRVGLSYSSCGQCAPCQSGQPFNCAQFFPLNFGAARLDGTTALSDSSGPIHSHFFGQSSFATLAVAPERNLVKLPDDVPFEVAAPFGCGVQTGAGAVLNTLRPHAGSTFTVFGAGAVGLSGMLAAKVAGASTIVAVDLRPQRLELAAELGATHTVNAGDGDPVERIKEVTGGGTDYALDTTGSPAAFRQASDCLAQPGTLGVVGASALGTDATIDFSTILFGKRIVGIVEGESVPQVFLPRLFDLWRAGQFPVDRFMKPSPFTDIQPAAEAAERGQTIKPVVLM